MHQNDIYWINLDMNDDLIQITFDGSIENSIYNGFNDYIYRGIFFASNKIFRLILCFVGQI